MSLYNDVPEIRDALRDEVQRLVHTSDEWRTRQAGQDLLDKFVRDDEELTKQAEVFEALSDLPGESIANEETGTEHSDRDGEFTVDPDENPEEIATSLVNDFKTNPTEWFTLLEDDDPTVRISACEFLAIVARSLPDRRETVVCKLYPLLADEDWRVRSSAITALTTVGREDPTLRGDVFIRIVDAFEDGDMGVRVAVLQALNQLVPETTDTSQRVSEILPAAVDDEEDRVRLQAVALLPAIAEHTSVSNELIAHCLIRAFQDESLTVRGRGKTVLREIAEIRADELDNLIGELSERFDQPDLRAELVFAVAGVVDDHPSVADTTIRGFRSLLKNTDIKPHTRAMTISTLSDFSELSNVPAQLPAEGILIGMKDESPDVREQAFQSLPIVADTTPELLVSKVEILIDVLEREYAAVTADIQLDDSVEDVNEFPNNSPDPWTFGKDISAEESSSFTISTDPLSAETQTAVVAALVTTYWSDEPLQITADQRSVLEGIVTDHSSTPEAQTLLIDMLAHLHSRNETFSESGARL